MVEVMNMTSIFRISNKTELLKNDMGVLQKKGYKDISVTVIPFIVNKTGKSVISVCQKTQI